MLENLDYKGKSHENYRFSNDFGFLLIDAERYCIEGKNFMSTQDLLNMKEIELILIASERYCIGRHTCAPDNLISQVSANLSELSMKCLAYIVEDIEKHKSKDMKLLGFDGWEQQQWLDFEKVLCEEIRRRNSDNIVYDTNWYHFCSMKIQNEISKSIVKTLSKAIKYCSDGNLTVFSRDIVYFLETGIKLLSCSSIPVSEINALDTSIWIEFNNLVIDELEKRNFDYSGFYGVKRL